MHRLLEPGAQCTDHWTIGQSRGVGVPAVQLITHVKSITLYGRTVVLNDKITIIVNLQYRKGFLVLVSEKGMEILYYFKSFNANYKKGRLITSYSFLVVLS